eukprot:3300497-Prymnesium_polylepis.1
MKHVYCGPRRNHSRHKWRADGTSGAAGRSAVARSWHERRSSRNGGVPGPRDGARAAQRRLVERDRRHLRQDLLREIDRDPLHVLEHRRDLSRAELVANRHGGDDLERLPAGAHPAVG